MKPETSTNTADANRVGSTGGSAEKRRPRLNASEIRHLIWLLTWEVKNLGHCDPQKKRQTWTYPRDIAAKLSRMLPNTQLSGDR